MSVRRTEAIGRFLINGSPAQSKDLAQLYHPGMEVQVNVAQDNGERIEGDYQGRKWHGWSDGLTTWKSFRVPYDAKSNPHYDDPVMSWDLAEHTEGIGMTGWEWSTKTSKWVAFDFDSIIGHKAGLTESQLEEVKKKAEEIPWVTTRKSTSGKGIHLYVFVDNIQTENHNEHAALARAIIGKMSSITGLDFATQVDVCGGNIWVWHRKQKDTDGLALIKQGTILKKEDIPPNWKEHVDVIKGVRKRVRTVMAANNTDSKEEDLFEKLSGQYTRIPLDAEHKKLLQYLEDNNCVAWWDADHYMLVTHTIHLKEAHNKLNLKGIFETKSSHSTPQNCFCYALQKGGWIVRRYGQGVQEHESWEQDSAGWTRCYFNRPPDLKTVAKLNSGIAHEKGGFLFKIDGGDAVQKTCKMLGIELNLPPTVLRRDAEISFTKDRQLKVKIKYDKSDRDSEMATWYEEKGYWVKLFQSPLPTQDDLEVANTDDIVRHVVSESGEDAGWVIKSDNMWRFEPLPHIIKALKSLSYAAAEAEQILGKSVLRAWIIVNKPFQSEYPGARQWNKDGAQLRYIPTDKDRENLKYPTWLKILNHIGKNLDEVVKNSDWAKQNGMVSGADYLKCWIASMLQSPYEPLPYLFLCGPQNCGKSILHEALSLLVTKGVVRADNALKESRGFNGELAGAVLCVVEETELGQNNTVAYNRIKDWVTARTLPIHPKGGQVYTIPNTTHWIQCANEIHACPIFNGDTRITLIRVDDLGVERIPKKTLFAMLEEEGPDFTRALMNLEIPKSNDRMNIPVLETQEKLDSIEVNKSPVEVFCDDKCFYAPGQVIPLGEFYDTFMNWLEPERRGMWGKVRMGRDIPSRFVKGPLPAAQSAIHVANISWTQPSEEAMKNPKFILQDRKLVLERRPQ